MNEYYLEVKRNEREYEAFQILYKIIEDSQAFRILTFLHVKKRTDFRCLIAEETCQRRQKDDRNLR